MRRILIATCTALFIMAVLAGCNAGQKDHGSAKKLSQDAAATAPFPKELAGRWVGGSGGWEITIDPNGTIPTLQHSQGRVEVVAGRINAYPLVNNGKAVVKPGRWNAVYDPFTHTLTVCIELVHFRWETGENIIEGNSVDFLSGKVADDFKTWEAEWENYPTYFISTDKVKNKNLPAEQGFDLGVVVFTKNDVPATTSAGSQ